MNRSEAPVNLKLAGAVSAGMRVLLLASKFVFMVALARMTSPATVGVYTLAVTVSTILVYVVGAEIHTYTTREIVGLDSDSARATHVQNHFRFVLAGYLVSLPMAWSALWWLQIDTQMSFMLFAVVLIGEILCQELGRYLLALSQPIASNFLQVLRAAAWMPAAIWGFSSAAYRAGDIVLLCWAGGCAAAAVFGLWRLRPLFTQRQDFSWVWLQNALSSARHYFAVVLLTQAQSYSDRFIVQYHLGEHSVGLLAFYQSFANTVQGFVQTGVISILLPRLLIAVHREDGAGARAIRHRMYRTAMGVAVLLALVMWAGMGTVLSLIGRDEYREVLHLFPWLLLGNVLLIAGQIPHLQLYALRQDHLLMWVSIVIVPLSVVANLVVVPWLGLPGAVAVFVGSAAVQAAVKAVLSRRIVSRRGSLHVT